MVSLKDMRSRRVSRPVRARSAPGRISLNKSEIVKMTPGEARNVLRGTKLSSFASMGKRGLYLIALLLILATTPAEGFSFRRQVAPPKPATAMNRVKSAFRPMSTSEKAKAAAEVAASVAAAGLGGSVGSAVTGALLLRTEYYLQFYVATMGIIYVIYKMKMKNKNLELKRLEVNAARERNDRMERMFNIALQRGISSVASGGNPTVAAVFPAALAGPQVPRLGAPAISNARQVRVFANRIVPRRRAPTNAELLARLG